MVDGSLVYVDGTPLLTRAALSGDVSASQGSNTLTIGAGRVTNAMLAGSYTVAHSAVAASVTGTASETALANIALPALGANSVVCVEMLWTYTSSANTKTPRVRLHTATGTGGTAFFAPGIGSGSATMKGQCIIANRNSVSSQVSAPAGAGFFGGYGTSSLALTTGTVNTGSTPFINITGQLASSGETLTLESYTVHVWRA